MTINYPTMTLPPPLVSIIIPTFNRAAQIGEAARSCLEQTHSNCEIIVVDDGSTDDTAATLTGLQASDRLRVLSQKNTGASAARNSGLDAAQGAYIQFLDSDDVLMPEKITMQLAALEAAPDCEVVLCYGRLEKAKSSVRAGIDLGENPIEYVEALCGREVHVISTASPLWRREFLYGSRRWDPTISLGDDLDFHVRCLAEARRVAFVPLELFTVRDHDGDRLSDFSNDDQRLLSLLSAREYIFRWLAARNRWTTQCAENSVRAMRSLYVNFLRRMPKERICHLEELVLEMGLPLWRSAALYFMIGVRRVLGRKVVLALFNVARPKPACIKTINA